MFVFEGDGDGMARRQGRVLRAREAATAVEAVMLALTLPFLTVSTPAAGRYAMDIEQHFTSTDTHLLLTALFVVPGGNTKLHHTCIRFHRSMTVLVAASAARRTCCLVHVQATALLQTGFCIMNSLAIKAAGPRAVGVNRR